MFQQPTKKAPINKAPVQTWFGEGKIEEVGDFDDDGAAEVIPNQAHNKKDSASKNKHNQEVPIDDDWD